MFSNSQLQQAVDLLDQADALIVAAGAGMGVDSGLPDFRGTKGFWQAYPELGRQEIEFHEVASPAAFRRRPVQAWGFYGHRLNLYRNTVPHRGFAILKEWGASKTAGLQVFTSNVDGQFQRAGLAPESIHECHGSIHHLQCMLPCHQEVWSADDFHPEVDDIRCELINAAPVCPHCGGLARPNILMFNDWDWQDQRQQEQEQRQQAWLQQVRRPLVIEIGAGTAIPTVRHFSRRIVQQHGGRLLRINVREFSVDHPQDVGLAAGGLAALTALNEIWTARHPSSTQAQTI